MFLAVGHNGMRLTSKDGVTWGTPEMGKDGQTYRAAAFGNGRFVTVGSFGGDNVLASSADGKSWELGKREGKYRDYFRGLTFGNGSFIALGGDPGSVGAAKPFVAFSKDGITWEDNSPIDGKYMLRRAAFGNGLWVAVGDRGRIAASPDGKVWKDAEGTKPIDTLVDVSFGNGVFVGVGLHGLRRSSTDGIQWSEPARGEEGEHLNSVVFTGRQFVTVGAGATYFSPNGKDWKRVPNQNAPTFATFGDGALIGTTWRGRLLRSTDGIAWKDVHKCDHPVEAVVFGAATA